MPGAEKGGDNINLDIDISIDIARGRGRGRGQSSKARARLMYIKSVSKRLRQLPESLYDIICNDYLGHHLYRVNVHTLQHAIKIHYDAINVYIAGKNGIVVYNTDLDGLVYTVLQSTVLFRNIVALIDTVQSHDARIKCIDGGDILRFFNGTSIYAHLVTSTDELFVYTIPITLYNYKTSDMFYLEKKRSTMAIERDYLMGMVSLDIFRL